MNKRKFIMTDTDTKKTFVGLLFAFLATMCWASNYPVNRLIFNAAGNVELDPRSGAGGDLGGNEL